jgi:hypothetical protein
MGTAPAENPYYALARQNRRLWHGLEIEHERMGWFSSADDDLAYRKGKSL